MAIANHKTYGNHAGDSYIWFNGPEGFTQEKRVDLPTGGPHGLMHQDLGNVYDRSPEEDFTSRVFTLDAPGVLTGITWAGEVPAKTWVRAEIRSAASVGTLGHAPWREVDGEVAVERHLQYRLHLGATNSVATPRITAVELTVRA